MPKVSVIIPVYNVEKYLRECLDSIVTQTLRDIEIICINDGSTDNSLEILKKYAQKDNRIVLINKENEGVSASRNIGIENAKPEAIVEALSKAHCTVHSGDGMFTEEDIYEAGLTGRQDSRQRRAEVGRLLGIGGGNAKALLSKLNSFSITREEFDDTIRTIDNKGH